MLQDSQDIRGSALMRQSSMKTTTDDGTVLYCSLGFQDLLGDEVRAVPTCYCWVRLGF